MRIKLRGVWSKNTLTKRRLFVLSVAVALLLTTGAAFTAQTTANRKLAAQVRQSEIIATKEIEAAKAAVPKEAKQKQQNETAPATRPMANTAPAQIKYSTSSDPRSTAYSPTPPQPTPESFSIQITHAGQLKAGDMVYYNGTKGEKGYYNGDLILTPAAITISRSGQRWAPITLTSPTDKAIGNASMPWDVQNPNFLIGWHTGNKPQPGQSLNMIVDAFNMPPTGTYQLHITAGCDWPGGWECQSDGFITIYVVE